MKKIISFLLAISFLLLVCSCNSLQTTDSQESTTDSQESTTDPNKSENTVDKESEIKQTVLKLMQDSEKQEDPASLFSYFDGDYEISNFTKSMDAIKTIKRKNAVSIVSASGLDYYGVEAAGFLFYVADHNLGSEVIGVLPLQTDMSHKSTIFTAFGIDTGALYGIEAEEDDIELTEDMLTVSEDKATCTFSKNYLDEMAAFLCESLGYAESQTNAFLNKYTGSGVYSVSDNKITFEIKLQDTSLGNIHQISSYSVDKNGKVNAYSFMEYSNPSLGMNTPVKAEISYKDVVYNDNKPISATIQVNSVADTSYQDGNYYGAPYITSTTTTKMTFTLDCSNADAPKGVAVSEKTSTESYQGESWTTKSTVNLSVDLSKSSSQFVHTEKRDGEIVSELKANKVTFATPSSFPAVPQRVTNCITNYIYKHF